MSYNAKAYKETEGLPAGIQEEGVIININDGKVRDFLQEDSRKAWEGDLDQTAINVEIELKHKEQLIRLSKIFTYKEEGEETNFAANSNLGKYRRFYGKLPEVEDKVKCMTNEDGYFRLTISA